MPILLPKFCVQHLVKLRKLQDDSMQAHPWTVQVAVHVLQCCQSLSWFCVTLVIPAMFLVLQVGVLLDLHVQSCSYMPCAVFH